MLDDQIKEILTLCSGQSISATGVITGTNKLVHPFRDALLLLNVTQVPQTSPKLFIHVETSEDDSTYFFHTALTDKLTQGSLTRTTAPVDEHCIKAVGSQPFWLLNLSRYLRLNVIEFGGSGTPSDFIITAKLSLYRR